MSTNAPKKTGSPSPARSRFALIAVGVLLISWAGPAANAFWQSLSSSNFAAAKADAIAAGTTPAVAVSGGSVTVSWAPSSTTAGRPVTGYSIARYAAPTGGTKIASGGGCAGTITTGLSCTEQNVPTGTWYYAVTPAIAQWQGTEGARSSGAIVDTTPPVTPTITAPPYVYSGNVTAVPVSGTTEAGASVTLTVTDPGTVHTVTQTVTANSSGNWTGTVNLTTLTSGTITFRAVATDSFGNASSPGTTTSVKDVTAPTVAGVVLANGGSGGGTHIGIMEPKDKVTVTYSEGMDASTFCSSWINDSTTQTEKTNNAVTVAISAGNVLTVTVAGAQCPTSRIGSVALGGSYYSSGTLTYKGTGSSASMIDWNPTTKTLTVTLGSLASGTPNATAQPAAIPSYTPPGGLTDLAGNPLGTGTVQGTASRF